MATKYDVDKPLLDLVPHSVLAAYSPLYREVVLPKLALAWDARVERAGIMNAIYASMYLLSSHLENAPVEVARVMKFGAGKYSEWNWTEDGGLSWRRLYNAVLRHIVLGQRWAPGPDHPAQLDPESALPHIAHALASLGMLHDTIARGIGIDDRPTPGWSL